MRGKALPQRIESDLPIAWYACRGPRQRNARVDLDWAALADRHGHSVGTMRRWYLQHIKSLRNTTPVPVERSITDARAEVGTDRVRDEILDGITKPNAVSRVQLVDLLAERAKRRSA